MRHHPPIADRLAAGLRADPETGCIIWTGKTNARGYGRLMSDGRMVLTHRVAYELANGPIPTGLVIDHVCRNTLCCNPAHLEAVTQRENTLRGDGPSARQAQQTHCKRGHPLSGDNIRMRGYRRVCRACCSIRKAEAA
jgi:hypothetical protein